MPISARNSSSLTSVEQIGRSGSNVALGRSRAVRPRARACPRSARRSFSSTTRWRWSPIGLRRAVDVEVAAYERASSTSGAPFTKQRTVPVDLVERRHELVLGVERHLADPRVAGVRVSSTSSPPLAASTTSAPSVGSPMHAPSRITASFANAIGSMKCFERLVADRLARPADAQGCGRSSSSPRRRCRNAGPRPRAGGPSSGSA